MANDSIVFSELWCHSRKQLQKGQRLCNVAWLLQCLWNSPSSTGIHQQDLNTPTTITFYIHLLHVKWVVLRYGQFSDTGSSRSQGARIRDVRVYSKGLETSHVRPLKRVTNSTGNPRHELSQFRAPEKERTRKIKEEDASSRSSIYEIFNNRITFWK